MTLAKQYQDIELLTKLGFKRGEEPRYDRALCYYTKPLEGKDLEDKVISVDVHFGDDECEKGLYIELFSMIRRPRLFGGYVTDPDVREIIRIAENVAETLNVRLFYGRDFGPTSRHGSHILRGFFHLPLEYSPESEEKLKKILKIYPIFTKLYDMFQSAVKKVADAKLEEIQKMLSE